MPEISAADLEQLITNVIPVYRERMHDNASMLRVEADDWAGSEALAQQFDRQAEEADELIERLTDALYGPEMAEDAVAADESEVAS